MARLVTAADLIALTGYTRNQLRALLLELPRFALGKSKSRHPTTYSGHEVLIVVICCCLESRYGLRRSVVAALCDSIADCTGAPRPVANKARLVINVDPPNARYAEKISDDLEEGIVVALRPILAAVDAYLLPTTMSPIISQRRLGMLPVIVSKSAAAANSAPARLKGRR